MGSKFFKNIKITNRVISIILLSIFLVLLLYTYNMDWSQKTARDGITAGFFPKAILIFLKNLEPILFLLYIIIVLKSIKNYSSSKSPVIFLLLSFNFVIPITNIIVIPRRALDKLLSNITL